jgi:hypothetical protein
VRVHSGACKALRVLFADRLRFRWELIGQRFELTDVNAKVVIYEAFVEGNLEAPKHLACTVHDLYFEPKYE